MDKTGNASPLQTTLDPSINIVSTYQPTQKLNPNRVKSSMSKMEMKRYGDLTNPDFLDSSDDEEPPHKSHAASIASYSPPKASTFQTYLHAAPYPSPQPATASSYYQLNRRMKHTLPILVTTTKPRRRRQ